MIQLTWWWFIKDDCLFCKIANKKVDAKILYEDEDLMVILDAYPDTDGHTLVIPKKHYEDIYSIDPEVFLKIFTTGKEKAQTLMNKLDKNSLTFLVNYGDAQAIKHFHLHLLPDFMHKEHKYSKEEIYDKLMKDWLWQEEKRS